MRTHLSHGAIVWVPHHKYIDGGWKQILQRLKARCGGVEGLYVLRKCKKKKTVEKGLLRQEDAAKRRIKYQESS